MQQIGITMLSLRRHAILILGLTTTVALIETRVHAQEQVAGITVVCPATGPGVAVCAGIGVLLEEAVKKLNGKDGFGENGEVMKILKAPVNIVSGNIKGSERESGDIDKAIRASTGISIKDINSRGLLGGDNSEARKVCNSIASVAGGKC